MSSKSFRLEHPITLTLEPRPDGGLRLSSDDVPGLYLSHSDPRKVLADLWTSLEGMLSRQSGEGE